MPQGRCPCGGSNNDVREAVTPLRKNEWLQPLALPVTGDELDVAAGTLRSIERVLRERRRLVKSSGHERSHVSIPKVQRDRRLISLDEASGAP
jgi:hypothetical protein